MKTLAFAACAGTVLFLSSCQSMSGLLQVSGHAIVYEDTEVDDIDAATSFDEEDLDLKGYGGQVAVLTPIVDVLGGIDRREYSGEEVTEGRLGLRRRFFEIWMLHPYIVGDARFGFDLDTGIEESDYTGWDLGLGALLDLGEHFFLDFKLVYEQTAEDIELPSGDTSLDGIVGSVGLGFAF
jgi:hypothetical protein